MNGNLHGKVKKWYPSVFGGHLQCECDYMDGNLHGKFKRWYFNGQLEWEHDYVNGIQQ
jgi:antitoxin component YwqK of YwqJK toxin-antitoxin module